MKHFLLLRYCIGNRLACLLNIDGSASNTILCIMPKDNKWGLRQHAGCCLELYVLQSSKDKEAG